MLLSRLYEPKGEELIYHYCSPSAFFEICTTKKLRFSDLFSMNDFMEMHWGYSIWEEVAGQVLPKVGKEFLDKVDQMIHFSGYHGLLVASCFSLDGDVLSQWRAYADDGRGYAIGFRAKDLVNLSVRALQVLYDKNQQVQELKSVIRAIHEVEQTETKKFSRDFKTHCGVLAFDLAAFKNPGFVEEKEIRLVHVLTFEKSGNFLRLVDDGGQAFGKRLKGVPVMFRMRDSTPVAYIDLDFTNKARVNPIKEVVIGPKNSSLDTGIAVFLETSAITSVELKHSKASYR